MNQDEVEITRVCRSQGMWLVEYQLLHAGRWVPRFVRVTAPDEVGAIAKFCKWKEMRYGQE